MDCWRGLHLRRLQYRSDGADRREDTELEVERECTALKLKNHASGARSVYIVESILMLDGELNGEGEGVAQRASRLVEALEALLRAEETVLACLEGAYEEYRRVHPPKRKRQPRRQIRPVRTRNDLLKFRSK